MLNLKYGQQAVSRGYITPQRLQQVLAKQRQLSDQGKKVSVRMILEKSKLLTPDQLDQVDRDLNIKVVKKKTSTINKAALQQRQPQKAVQSVSADNFMGDEALPDVSGSQGANPDATIYSPPPPDMQERIRQEREKAKAAVRQKQDAQTGRPAAQPQRPAAPQRPQPQPAFAEPMMEPEMEPEPFGEAAPELERMDSSPKLESLPAEYQGIASPEDEALPTLDGGGFDQMGEQPQQGGFDNLAPAEQGFDQFGEQGGMSGTAALGAEPEQGAWGEEASAAPSFDDGGAAPMDATMYSPPPPQYQPQAEPEAPEMQPQGFDNFGEDEAPAAPAFGDVGEPAAMDATLYSPPPSSLPSAEPEAMPEPEAEPEMAEPAFGEESPAFGEPEPVAPAAPAPKAPAKSEPPAVSGRKLPPGKKLVDDFADAEGEKSPKQPAGLDDVPTVKPRGEPVHPLRRGVSSEINALDSKQPTSKRIEAGRPEPVKAEAPKPGSGKLPKKAEPAPAPAEEESIDLPGEEPEPEAAPAKPSKAESKKPEPAKKSAAMKPAPQPAAEEPPKKKSKARTLLIFVLLLLIVVAVLVVPVVPEAQQAVPQLKQLRNNPNAKMLYDNVEKWANKVREMAGLPPWGEQVKPPIVNNPEGGQSGEQPKEEPKDTPKEEPKDTPKEEPKDTPKEEPKTDAFALYKKKGRVWVLKTVSKMGDMAETVSYSKFEVIEVSETSAKYKMWTLDAEKKPFAGMEAGTELEIKFEAPKATDGATTPAPKIEDGGEVEAAGRKWATQKMIVEANGLTTTAWTAKDLPGLAIKSVTDGETSGMKMHSETTLEEFTE